MGRELEFDYDKAIANATRLFREHGFANTSLRDLLKVMKIGEGSFYNTLKSKKLLYLECLKYYRRTVVAAREQALFGQNTAKEGVRELFKVILNQMDENKKPLLCLMAQSLSRDVLETPEFHEFIVEQGSAFVQRFVALLKSAQEKGEVHKDFDPVAVTQIIGAYTQGMSRSALLGFDRKRIEQQVNVLLGGLGL